MTQMIWHTCKIECNAICFNEIIDGDANNYDPIDISGILHRNLNLNIIKKITFECCDYM